MKEIITDLNINELIQGYTKDETKDSYRCIFCSEEFIRGVIYFSRGRNVDAQRATLEHIYDKHGGPFQSLLSLDREINGLTDIQKILLKSMYEDEANKTISERLDVKSSTVRTHKFKLQQLKREAKIFLALFEYIENINVINKDKNLSQNMEEIEEIDFQQSFSGNVLHPFFAQLNLK